VYSAWTPHVLEVARTETLDSRKFDCQVFGQPLDHLRASAFGILPNQNLPADGPLQQDKFPTLSERSPHLGRADTFLDLREERGVTGRYLEFLGHLVLGYDMKLAPEMWRSIGVQ
jgi:hypothetical protein